MKSNGHLAPEGCGIRPIAYASGHGFCSTDGLFAGQRAVLTFEHGGKLAIVIDAVDEEIGSIEFSADGGL